MAEKVSNLLAIPWGYEDEKLIQPRIMGQAGVDVVLRGDARDRFPFDIECKNTEKLTLYSDIEQATKNQSPGRMWLLVHKKNRSNPIVIMDAESFFEIMEKNVNGS